MLSREVPQDTLREAALINRAQLLIAGEGVRRWSVLLSREVPSGGAA